MRSELVSIRVRMLFVLIVLFSLVIVARLYFLQIIHGENYSTKADRQYLKPNSSILNRGTVYFRTKSGELVTAATQKTGYTVAINPSVIKDPETVYKQISAITPLDQKDFLARAGKKTDPYEEVAKRVDLSVGEEIDKLSITGVNEYKEKWRFYPNDSLASNVLGLVAFKGDDLAGRYGLEQYYEKLLKRENDTSYSNFFVEMFLNVQKTIYGDESAEGDIVTSIEPSVQASLEKEVGVINSTWNSEYTGGIVIDPNNGEIIAMAMAPTFNANDLKNESNPSIFSNKLVEDSFELGSVLKPVTMASGIDAGVVSAHTTYFDSGSITLNNKTISNFDKKGRGQTDMQSVLNESLNTGAVFVMQKIGKDRFLNYLTNFGLMEKTGIDLPNEAAPLVENLKSGRDVESATASFGQGISISPVIAVRAFSAIANGGLLVNPHVVTKINYKNGLSKDITFPEGRRVIKKETSTEIARMLTETVDTALLGGSLKMEHYSVSSKSGTAQIVMRSSKGYYDDRFLHSFFGYFPSYSPKFLVFLFTYHPKGAGYGADTLARPFFNMAKYLINYYDIPPDR